jgi:hypothetical protein
VILLKCVFVFEIFYFGQGTVPSTLKKIFKFFQPSARKVHSVHQEKTFFFLRLSPPEMSIFLTWEKNHHRRMSDGNVPVGQ